MRLKIGMGYEQEDPGFFIWDQDTGHVVWSSDVEPPLKLIPYLREQFEKITFLYEEN